MPTTNLLIVDGESLRTPGMLAAFGHDVWNLQWVSLLQVQLDFVPDAKPGVILLGPPAQLQGEEVIKDFQARYGMVPVVAALQPGQNPLPGASASLDLTSPPEQWPSVVRSVLPVSIHVPSHQLTSDDLFGDIVAGLEGDAADVEKVFTFDIKPEDPPAPKVATPSTAIVAKPTAMPTPPLRPAAPKLPVPQAPRLAPPVAPRLTPKAPVPAMAPNLHPQPVLPKALPAPSKATPHSTVPVPILGAHDPRPVPVSPETPAAPVPMARAAGSAAPGVPPPSALHREETKPAVSAPVLPLAPSAPPPPPAPVPPPPAPQAPAPPAPAPVPPPPAPQAPTPLPPASPLKPEPPPPSLVQSELQDLFGEFFAPAPMPPTPAQGRAGAQARTVPAEPPAKGPDEFTLSGISGIHDPFEALPEPTRATPVPETPPPAPVPLPRPASPKPQSPAPGMLDSQQLPILDEFGNYYLLEKIAVGGMAELFKARQRGVHDFQKIVAIKRILPHLSDNDEFVRMFIDEAKLAAQLTHPNIAQIFDLGKVSGFYYIAMEYVDGRDLRSMLRRVREFKVPFPEPIAAFIIMKVAGALDYAHRKRGMDDRELKLVHRDISPQNVLLSSEGAVKLVDFGIAKAATKSTQTVAGALKGKLLYMSPEQALGSNLDHRSDIYSLGLVLFELLTGERCFQADSELGVLEKVRLGKVMDIKTINPTVSTEMSAILAKALEKDVDKRYSSARLLERDLKALLISQSNDPAEHDVAEYANALLKGTKEQVELLIATKFPPPVRPSSPSNKKVHPHPVPAAASPAHGIPPVARSPLPPPPDYPESAIKASSKRTWLVPVLLVAVVVVLVVVWIAIKR